MNKNKKMVVAAVGAFLVGATFLVYAQVLRDDCDNLTAAGTYWCLGVDKKGSTNGGTRTDMITRKIGDRVTGGTTRVNEYTIQNTLGTPVLKPNGNCYKIKAEEHTHMTAGEFAKIVSHHNQFVKEGDPKRCVYEPAGLDEYQEYMNDVGECHTINSMLYGRATESADTDEFVELVFGLLPTNVSAFAGRFIKAGDSDRCVYNSKKHNLFVPTKSVEEFQRFADEKRSIRRLRHLL